MIDTNELRKAAKAVFLATEESVAEDLSGRLNEAARTIDELRAKDGGFFCVYCGKTYPAGTPIQVLVDHIKACEKHSLGKAEAKIDALKDLTIALKDLIIWMTGCGYDFCQHDYFCQSRDKLLKKEDQNHG